MTRLIFITISLLLSFGATAQLKNEALTKISELNDLITIAEQKRIDVRKEKMTVRLAEVFLDFADWDEANQEENTEYFDLVPIYRDSAEKMAALLPDFERQEVILMLEESIAFLEKLISGEYNREPIPNVNWSRVKHEGNQLTYEDRPVFLEDYTWKPRISRLTQYFGDLDGFFISPNYVQNENGTINPNIINDLNSKPPGSMGFIFINNQNVPDWAKNKYGSEFVFRPENNFTDYDIDHPGAKEMMGMLLDGTIGKMAGKTYTGLGYMLCNEPHWFTKKGVWATGGVSELTIEKFKSWLKNKHGDISELNSLWGSSFSGFDAVTIDIPISGTLQGTPMWYDWCRFNMFRVNDWYRWMKSKVKGNDPNAKTQLKIMPRLWEESHRDHGIDLEALTEMSEIIGQDGAARTNNMWGSQNRWWQEHFIFDWREVTMASDFMKSVSPEKIMFNSEAHYLSSSRSRNLYENPKYARAVYWLAHTFGLNASQTWFWPRVPDGSLKNAGKGYAGSNCQQPRATHQLHATIMDLNSHSEEITAMQRERKPLRIFHSETSAINKPEHMEEDVFELYKELSFEGIPLGFTTQKIIEKQSHNAWDAVLIYKTQNVTRDELNAIQSYLDGGGTVIMDEVSLSANEYGHPLSALSESNGTLKVVNTLENFKDEGLKIVKAKGLLPEFIINESNSHNVKTCHWKSITNAEGEGVLSIINFGNVNSTIDIEYKNDAENLVYKNLLNGTVLSKNEPVVLEPFDMLFLAVVDSSTLVKKNEVVNVLYPNPTTGAFNINFEITHPSVEMQVFDVAGKLILEKNFTEVDKIFENIEGHAVGNYVIRLKIGEEVQSYKLLKVRE